MVLISDPRYSNCCTSSSFWPSNRNSDNVLSCPLPIFLTNGSYYCCNIWNWIKSGDTNTSTFWTWYMHVKQIPYTFNSLNIYSWISHVNSQLKSVFQGQMPAILLQKIKATWPQRAIVSVKSSHEWHYCSYWLL